MLPTALQSHELFRYAKTDTNTVPVKNFKNLSTLIAPPLCKLINFYFSMRKFTDMLKIACITPIFKKGDRQNPCDYRLIASLPYISKIFERYMANKQLQFINKFLILHSYQFGFQNYISTFDALLDLTVFIYKGLNEKKTVVNIFIDLRKAFDTVSHGALLDKLYMCGIRGIPPEWLKLTCWVDNSLFE